MLEITESGMLDHNNIVGNAAMTQINLRQFMAGFLSITFAFIFLAVVSPTEAQAKSSSVSSTRATLNPPNPKPGESFFVEISGSGSQGSW